MLPTCIGISGVSRYRNEASIEDSFLASLIFPSQIFLTGRSRGALPALLAFKRSLYGIPGSGSTALTQTLAFFCLSMIFSKIPDSTFPYHAPVRIVHFPEAHMQWQTGPIGQIGRIRPQPGPADPRPPTKPPHSPPCRYGSPNSPPCFQGGRAEAGHLVRIC